MHVLLGLLREGENNAVAVLHHAGISLSDLRTDLERAIPRMARPLARLVVLPETDGERSLLARADEERGRCGHDALGPEHLLLAMLGCREDPAAAIVARHGLVYEGVAAHMAATIHYHPRPAPESA